MARGMNVWVGSGNIGGEISSGETHKGDPFYSFQVALEGRNRQVTWVRINVYGPMVELCKVRAKKGQYVVVKGELMNRGGSAALLEVRCEDLSFVPGGAHDEQREAGSQEREGAGDQPGGA